MLDGIFTFESTRQRHYDAPLLAERDALLRAMLKQGTSVQRLRSVSSMLLHVVRIMNLQGVRRMDVEEIHAAAKQWATQTEHKNRNGQKNQESLFVYVALKWC